MRNFTFNDVKISKDHKPYFIAEVGQAHDGSLGMAHSYIEAAAKAGADAVKFQTHIAAEESTKEDVWRVKFSYQDDTRYEYWERMEFSETQWLGLKQHCDDLGIDFISTPFSFKAVDLLDKIGVPFWKVASGEINNLPLLKYIAKTGKPVMISSGMSSLDELKTAVTTVEENGCQYAVLQCTSAYPCPPQNIGLNNIPLFENLFECPIGFSDHSGDIYASLAAIALGASIVEAHIVFDKEMFGPDASSSLTPKEFKKLIDGANYIHDIITNPVDKNEYAKNEMSNLRKLFNKSLVAKSEIVKGTILTKEHFVFKKPGKGLSPDKIDLVVGKTLKNTLQADQILYTSDIVEEI